MREQIVVNVAEPVQHHLNISVLTWQPLDVKAGGILKIVGLLKCQEEGVYLSGVPGYVLYAPPSRTEPGYEGQMACVTDSNGQFSVELVVNEVGAWQFEAVFPDRTIDGVYHIGD